MSITLIGDSVLDNFYWLDDQEQDVTYQLQKRMPNYTVKNFAVDESTINCVLNGICPQKHYSNRRLYPYPTTDGVVYPLKLLENEQKTDNDYIVVSVGGNDGRVHLNKLLWGSDELLKSLLQGNKFTMKLEKLIYELMKHTNKVILVFVYKPHVSIFEQFRSQVGFGLQYIPFEKMIDFQGRLDKVYDTLRNIYLDVAKKYNIPLIDLSKTFNKNDRQHYGSTPIEPSNLSGDVIANLIENVINEYDQRCTSSCYYSPNCSGKIVKQTIN